MVLSYQNTIANNETYSTSNQVDCGVRTLSTYSTRECLVFLVASLFRASTIGSNHMPKIPCRVVLHTEVDLDMYPSRCYFSCERQLTHRVVANTGMLLVFPTEQVFKQANAFLRSLNGPSTPETTTSTRQNGAHGAADAIGQGRKESVLGAIPGPSGVVGGGGGGSGGGGLSLPTLDLDLLDQEVGILIVESMECGLRRIIYFQTNKLRAAELLSDPS